MKLLHSKPHSFYLEKWARNHAYKQKFGVDLGYAIHAAFARTFGEDHPRCFRYSEERGLFVYTNVDSRRLQEIIAFGDAEAIAALGLSEIAGNAPHSVRDLPDSWEVGQEYLFEVEALPTALHQNREVGLISKALHGSEPDAFIDQGQLLRDWFMRNIKQEDQSWNNAIEVKKLEIMSKKVIPITRKRDENGVRTPHWLKLDKVVFRGVLTITDVEQFKILLARGIGGNRTFGSGMILLTRNPT